MLLISLLHFVSMAQVVPTNSVAEMEAQLTALVEAGSKTEAISLAKRWAATNETMYGFDHTNTVTSLADLAWLYEGAGDYTNAKAFYERGLRIREKILGLEHPDTAESLSSLAGLCYTMGDYERAESLYLRSIKIREKVLGPRKEGFAASLNDLAGLYERTGHYVKAEPLFQQSLKIYEQIVGREHSYTAASLNNLAGLYYHKGDYQKADEYFQQSLKICEKVFGQDDLHTASVLNSLCALYTDTGDYAKAESACRRSLTIKEKVLGPEHPSTATSLNNLAALYDSISDYAKAESLYQQSLAIREKVLGPDHPDTAMSVNNLASLYDTIGEYAKAELLFQRSLKICQGVLGMEHPDTAAVMDNLAKSYRHMGEPDKAEQLYQQSLKIREKVLGAAHSDTALSMKNLALLYQGSGNYAKAEPLFRKSLEVMEEVFGFAYPPMADFYQDFGFLMIEVGHGDQAISIARKEKRASEAGLGTILSFTSERQRMNFQRKRHPYDLLATLGDANDLAGIVVHSKGVILDSLLEDELVAQESKDPAMKRVLEHLREEGRRLADLDTTFPSIPGREASAKLQANRRQLEQKIEDLQRALARNVASLGLVRRSLRITVPEVQTLLTKHAVLLEFIRYDHYLGKLAFEPRYGVVLLGSLNIASNNSKPGEPVWVPLGSAEAIERNLEEYGAAMRGEKRGELSLLRTLYTQLFEPIQKMLPKGITTLVISPDAELNFMSFATLVNEQDRFLAEQYTIKYVACGRDLVFGRAGKKGSRRLAAFANPAFGEKPAIAGASATNAVHLAMLTTDQRDYAGVTLAPLPNTLQEAEFLRERSSAWNMQGVMYAGAEATEAEVKAVKSPYILHLATHGFFLPDTLPTNQPAMDTRLLGQERMPVVLQNPMQRSGLAFAGAQLTLDAWKHGETPNPGNDGILTAQEVGTMDLKETWLVVLSACDTGVGEARAGEGVLGLRRGFIQAGAQNLLMTLWPVSDKWTVEMMKAFYERALKEGDASGALAQVQRDYLVKLREAKDPVMAARLAGPFILTFQGPLKD